MPQPREQIYTIEDIYRLPEGQRAELIDGQMYMMSAPSFTHQRICFSLSRRLADYVDSKGGNCTVVPAPFAVILKDEGTDYVEPDISVICDEEKIKEHGCIGAPDFIVEVVSPSSRKMDYSTKNTLYSDAGVREYWIVDPEKSRTTIYRYEEDAAPTIIPFDQDITVGIYGDLQIKISDILN